MPQQVPFDVEGIEFCCTVKPTPEMIDYNGHLNIGYFAILFEDAARAIFSRLDISKAYRDRNNAALFAAESHMVFRREVLPEEAVSVYWRLLGFDGRKVHCIFFMVKANNGTLAAAQEILFLHVDLSVHRVAQIPEPQASRLAELLQKHGQLPPLVDEARPIGPKMDPGSAATAAGVGR